MIRMQDVMGRICWSMYEHALSPIASWHEHQAKGREREQVDRSSRLRFPIAPKVCCQPQASRIMP